MSLREQYQFLFDLTYNDELREHFLSQPYEVLKEARLDPEECRPLSQGRINRMHGESRARRAYYLNIFFSSFPRTTFVLTSACRSLEPLNSFFSSPGFQNCFSRDESFVDAFNGFLTEQVQQYASQLPPLPDLHSFESAIHLLHSRPVRERSSVTRKLSLDHARRLVQSPHTLLRRFTYPITEIVDYIDYFKTSSWYRLAPLYAAACERMPTLVIPHEPLSEPLLVLLTLQGTRHRILKIKPSQYDALIACDGKRSCEQVLETVAASELPQVAAWLDYCWQNRMLEYFDP